MSIQAAQLIAKVEVSGDVETKARLDAVGRKVDEASTGFGALGNALRLGLLVAGTAVVGLGAASIKMAGDFNAGLTTLVTGAGESKKNLQLIHDGILAMSPAVGQLTRDLIAGAYMIESSGQRGAQALNTLRDAAEGAKVGAASLADVANGVTTEMTDYASSRLTSAQATNNLIATTAAGKTRLGDLANAMASILPAASAMGIKLMDVSGAMATMTAEGTPAADAATYLRQTLLSLESPGNKAQSVFKEVGLTSKQVADEMKVSLPGTLRMIVDAVGKTFPEGSQAYVNALKDIAGGSKTFQGMLELTGSHLAVFEQNTKDITKAVRDGGTSVVGWTEVQKDFNFQLDQARASFDAVLIKVGEQLMPIMASFISQTVMPAITRFGEWATRTTTLRDAFQTVVDVLGGTIGAVQSVVSWFARGTLPAIALKDAIFVLAGTIALVKIGNIVTGIGNFISAVPQLLSKIFLVQQAAQGVAGAQGMASIGTAARTAASDVATAAAGMKLSLIGMITAVGGVALLETTIAQGLHDNGYTKDLPAAPPGYRRTGNHDVAVDTGYQAKQAADALKQQSKDIQQAYSDLAALYDLEKSWAGYDPGSNLPFFNSAIVKANELKSRLDDIADPVIIRIQTPDEEKADLKIRTLKSRLDDLSGPFIPQIGLRPVDAAMLKVQILKSQLDDLANIPPPSNPTTGNRGTVRPPGFASGVTNFAGGLAYVHQNELLVNLPRGTDVVPAGNAGGMSSGGGAQPIFLQIDGQTFARLTLPYHPGALRSNLGVIGV